MKLFKALSVTFTSYRRLALLLLLLAGLAFYSINSPLRKSYLSLVLSSEFTENNFISFTELSNLLTKKDPLILAGYNNQSINNYLSSLSLELNEEQLIIEVDQTTAGKASKSGKDNFDLMLKSQLAEIIKQITAKKSAEIEKSKDLLETQITAKEKTINSLESKIISIKQQLIKNRIADDLKILQTFSESLGPKHPKMAELYNKISAKYRELGLSKPDYDQLIATSVNEIITPGLTEDEYLSQEKILAEERAGLNKLELQLNKINNNFTNLDLPLLRFKQSNFYLAVLSKVLLPAFVVVFLLFFIWAFINLKTSKIISDKQLFDEIDDVPLYAIKDIKKVVSGGLNKEQQQASPKAIAYQGEQPFDMSAEDDSSRPSKSLVKQNNRSLPALIEKEYVASFELEDLASALLLKAQQKQQQTFVCTSASSEKNNAELIINFTQAIAKFTAKVLLIDAAFNTQRISSHFDLSEKPGFSEYISRKARLDQVINPGNLPNLSVIPAGSLSLEFNQMILKPRFDQAYSSLKKRFDFIVLATGALDSDATAKLLAQKLSGVYLIGNQQSNTLAVIQEALLKLRNLDVEPEGVIFKKAD